MIDFDPCNVFIRVLTASIEEKNEGKEEREGDIVHLESLKVIAVTDERIGQ